MLIELNTQKLVKFHDMRNFMTSWCTHIKIEKIRVVCPYNKERKLLGCLYIFILIIFSRLEIMIPLWSVDEGQHFWYAAAPSVELCADS